MLCVVLCCLVLREVCRWTPPPPDLPSAEPPKFSLFFALSRSHFRSFALSLSVFSWNFGGICSVGTQECTFGPENSGVGPHDTISRKALGNHPNICGRMQKALCTQLHKERGESKGTFLMPLLFSFPQSDADKRTWSSLTGSDVHQVAEQEFYKHSLIRICMGKTQVWSSTCGVTRLNGSGSSQRAPYHRRTGKLGRQLASDPVKDILRWPQR